MLQIRDVQMLPDGRSIVETWGTYRFRIMERGVLDGYTVGRVERVEDIVDEDADAADIAASLPPRDDGDDDETKGPCPPPPQLDVWELD